MSLWRGLQKGSLQVLSRRRMYLSSMPNLEGLDNSLIITNSCVKVGAFSTIFMRRLIPLSLKRITQLQKAANNSKLALRVAVEGGGCSGFQYTFETTEGKNEDDLLSSVKDSVILY